MKKTFVFLFAMCFCMGVAKVSANSSAVLNFSINTDTHNFKHMYYNSDFFSRLTCKTYFDIAPYTKGITNRKCERFSNSFIFNREIRFVASKENKGNKNLMLKGGVVTLKSVLSSK